PVMLDEVGLEHTIEWYLPVVERQTGIGISYEKSGTPYVVSGSAAVHVYRVLQEALNNVVRHSGAKQDWVRLRFASERLQLEIEDHGMGFSALRPHRGLGLGAIRQLAEFLRGELNLRRR